MMRSRATIRRWRTAKVVVTAWLIASAALAQPAPDPLPEAPGKALVVRACTTCHQIQEVIAKPKTAQDWDNVVGAMVDRGAMATDAEQDQIVAYLSRYFGPPAASPTRK